VAANIAQGQAAQSRDASVLSSDIPEVISDALLAVDPDRQGFGVLTWASVRDGDVCGPSAFAVRSSHRVISRAFVQSRSGEMSATSVPVSALRSCGASHVERCAATGFLIGVAEQEPADLADVLFRRLRLSSR